MLRDLWGLSTVCVCVAMSTKTQKCVCRESLRWQSRPPENVPQTQHNSSSKKFLPKEIEAVYFSLAADAKF